MSTPFSCSACGGELEPWIAAEAADRTIHGTFRLWRCSACGSARTEGEAPPDVYESGTYGDAPPRGRALIDLILRAFAREKVSILRRVAPAGAQLVDVGAGAGRFVMAAQAAGYNASGIEPSTRGSVEAGSGIRRGAVEDVELPPATLDVATMWHVLEHLDEPASTVGRIAGWLRPGGVLIVAVPNLASLQARMGGPRWFHLDVPRHRTHFTSGGLRRLAENAGLEPFFERHVLLEHNPYGMWQTWTNRMTDSPAYLYNLLKRNARPDAGELARTLAAALLAPAAVVAELGAGLCRRGGTFVLAARRP